MEGQQRVAAGLIHLAFSLYCPLRGSEVIDLHRDAAAAVAVADLIFGKAAECDDERPEIFATAWPAVVTQSPWSQRWSLAQALTGRPARGGVGMSADGCTSPT
jgi:hypothetical protein